MAFARPTSSRRGWSLRSPWRAKSSEVAERKDDTTYRLVGYRLLGTMQFFMGRNREAWTICNGLNNTAIPTGKSCSAIALDTIPTLSVLCCKIMAADLFSASSTISAAQVAEQLRVGSSRTTNMRPLSPLCRFFRHLAGASLRRSRGVRAPQRRTRRLLHRKKSGAMASIWRHSLTRAPAQGASRQAENIAAVRAAHDAKHPIRRAYVGLDDLHAQLAEALLAAGDVPSGRSDGAGGLRLC